MKKSNTNNTNTTTISKEDLIKKLTAQANPAHATVCMSICVSN
jgi:hypothetical protein